MIDQRFTVRNEGEAKTYRGALAEHRRVCGPACFEGDQIAEYVAEYEARTSKPPAAPREAPSTVQRVDLWGNLIDTHQTEAELNGFRPTQGRML